MSASNDTVNAAAPSIWEAPKWPAQRCTARRSDGEPCRAWAITGGNVCVYHGGKAPQVREAARRRLEGLVPEALETLADLTQGRAADPSTGSDIVVPPAVRARAAAEILSRAGVAAVSEQDIVISEGPARHDLDSAIANALSARGLLPPTGDVGTGDVETGEAATGDVTTGDV